MSKLKGKCVIAQSGGPTAVINASACGAIQEALKYPEVFTGIYGAENGILGVLTERLFDLSRESSTTIEGLKATPAAALGSCRYKLKSFEADRTDYERIIEVFKAHDIRYFLYCGGNDSMDTADKISRLAEDMKYDMIALGVPKTVDNDLAETDHCPGYGSVAKYLATSVMEAGRDTESLYTTDTCTIIEVMGRNAGWIAAATGLARREPNDAPHLIYLPEIPFTAERFIEEIKTTVRAISRAVVVVGEGLRDDRGEYITTASGSFSTDAFGHKQLGGVGDYLQTLVDSEVGVKTRVNRLGTHQRSAMHYASLTDRDEAWMVGQAAVRAALDGVSRKMITLLRAGSGAADYTCTTGLADLSVVANGEKRVPREFINEDGNHITQAMREYVTPLIRGEVQIPLGPDGLPAYVRLEKHRIPPRTAPYTVD